MEKSVNQPTPQNLTGQLSEIDYRPKFTGNYSTVYKGSLNGSPVAIKAIKATGGEDSVNRVNRRVQREIRLWAGTNHKNIHAFYGFVNDDWFGPFGALVSPWCFNGDATEYLRRNGEQMVVAERINLWRGVIEGVSYLHRHNPAIVHGDLKPRNILIDALGAPRICDFGLARVFLEAESTGMTTTSEHTGTTRYLAPELVASEVTVYPTTASDVYALGCLGLEFIYDQKPYSHRLNNIRGQIVIDIKRNVPPATSAPNQSWASQQAWSLIRQLWSLNPDDRPSAFSAISLLNHATRSLPPAVIDRIVLFSATFNEGPGWDKSWRRRTQALITLILVSKSLCARAMPYLYQDIRIFPTPALSRLSRLANTLNSSIVKRRDSDRLSPGYGVHTKTFLLCLGKDVHALSVEMQHLLDEMTRLHTLIICTADYLRVTIPVHYLSTVVFRGASPSLILEQEMLRALLPMQRLCIVLDDVDDVADRPALNISRIRQTSLFPNLQDIDLQDMGAWGTDEPTQLFDTFTNWVTPRLNYLSFNLRWGPPSLGAAFTRFLRAQGLHFRCLTLRGAFSSDMPSISDILSLCGNLQSLAVRSYSSIDLLSFPHHAKLEMIDIEDRFWYARGSGDPYLDQFETFTSSWRTRYHNLRVARLKAPEFNSSLRGKRAWLEMTFHTDNSFYTVNDGAATHKRWEGNWISAGK